MEPFIQRIVEEKQQLDERLTKLSSFIEGDKFKDVVPVQRHLLERQRDVMTEYSNILKERLDDLYK